MANQIDLLEFLPQGTVGKLRLSKQWNLELTPRGDEDESVGIRVYNPDPTHENTARFFEIVDSPVPGKHNQPIVIQESSLGIDLTSTENPNLASKRLVGAVVVSDGKVTDRYSLTNLELLQGGKLGFNLETGELSVNGDLKGRAVCFIDPDKNRLDGLVVVISPDHRLARNIKKAKVLELQDLCIIVCEAADSKRREFERMPL